MLTDNITGASIAMTTENITAATLLNASIVTMTTEHMTTDLTTDQTTSVIYSTTAGTNCTQPIPAAWGYISAVIAVIFYGSNFAPVKKFETGDGMFFQWIVCTAILLVGIVVQIIRNAPKFLPLVMIGGVIWETGNICVVPIIKTIGMGIGLCIWGMTNLLSGWATARFGLFGVEEEVPDNPTLNYIGVILAVFSAVIFSFVKNEITPVTDYTIHDSENEPLLSANRQSRGTSDSLYSTTQDHDPLVFNRRGSSSINNIETSDETVIDKLSPGWKRFIGLFLSVFSGVLYGQIFTVSTYYQDKDKNLYSQNALDYVFACFCGIYVSSTVYFVIYIIIMKNKPRIYPKVILPGIVSGLMWGIATCGWFVANKVLSEPVAFPIVTTVPAIVASIWGVFVFREIKGTRNLGILLLGMTIAVTGAVLAGLSKKPKSGC